MLRMGSFEIFSVLKSKYTVEQKYHSNILEPHFDHAENFSMI